MVNSQYEPTPENIFSTFIDNKINRNEDVFAFIELLNSIEENYSIALDGQWGSGKTFFVKHTIMVLDSLYGSLHSDFKDNYKQVMAKIPQELTNNKTTNFPIYFDAWENDNDDDPLLSLLYCIAYQYKVNFPSERNWDKALSEIMNITIDNPITTAVTAGMNKIIKNGTQKVKVIQQNFMGDAVFAKIEKTKKLHKRISAFFDKITDSRSSERIVIFIDELDRCKPSYAVQLLERIKHYMLHEKITFVFSTNLTELSHTVKQCYGNDFDGSKYLEKFFTEIHEIPELSPEQTMALYNFSHQEYKHFILHFYLRHHHIPLRSGLKLSKKIRAHFSSLQTYPPYEGSSNFMFLVDNLLIPYILCLKVCDRKKYETFINGNSSSIDSVITEFLNIPHITKIFMGKIEKEQDESVVDKFSTFYSKIFITSTINQPYTFEPYTIGSIEIPSNAKERILEKIKQIK